VPLFASTSFGRLVSGASTHRIAAAVTLVRACGVSLIQRPAGHWGCLGYRPPAPITAGGALTRIVPSSDVSCRFAGTATCRLQPIGSCDFYVGPFGPVLSDQRSSIDLLSQDRRPHAR